MCCCAHEGIYKINQIWELQGNLSVVHDMTSGDGDTNESQVKQTRTDQDSTAHHSEWVV